jgi:hypothetical protein
MSALIEFLDSDATTVITTVNEGNRPTPSTSAGHKFFVKNIGDQTAQSVAVSIEQVGTNDGYLYGQIAPDVSGSPGSWQTTPLSLSNIAAGNSTALWFREVLVGGLTPDNNPRRYNILCDYGTI